MVSFSDENEGAALPKRRSSVRGTRLVRRSTSFRGSGSVTSDPSFRHDSRSVFYESLLGRAVKRILDEPESSPAAFWYCALSNTVVMVSVALMFISTVKTMNHL
jgi:hypothetical protein